MQKAVFRRVKLHPLIVRVTHWVNAIAVIVMIGSGWRIYNNVPIFDFTFPIWMTLGGDPEITYKRNGDVGFSNALLWHFAAMWVFFINGLVALGYGFISGRLRVKWQPVSPSGFVRDVRDALRLRLSHDDPSHYNAVQRVMYIGVILALLFTFLSGLAIWKPVQFQTLTWMFYDFQGARLAHFLGMAAICLFLAVHVALAILVPKTLVGMTTGSVNVKEPAARPAPGE